MNFEKMMNEDLQSCTDMGGICNHSYDKKTAKLEYLYFEEQSEVIFQKSSEHDEIEANIPSIVFATTQAVNISHKSLFEINNKNYNVVSIEKSNNGISRVYLGEDNG